jgi:hypothetical protein
MIINVSLLSNIFDPPSFFFEGEIYTIAILSFFLNSPNHNSTDFSHFKRFDII